MRGARLRLTSIQGFRWRGGRWTTSPSRRSSSRIWQASRLTARVFKNALERVLLVLRDGGQTVHPVGRGVTVTGPTRAHASAEADDARHVVRDRGLHQTAALGRLHRKLRALRIDERHLDHGVGIHPAGRGRHPPGAVITTYIAGGGRRRQSTFDGRCKVKDP